MFIHISAAGSSPAPHSPYISAKAPCDSRRTSRSLPIPPSLGIASPVYGTIAWPAGPGAWTSQRKPTLFELRGTIRTSPPRPNSPTAIVPWRQRAVHVSGCDRRGHGQIDRRLGDFDAAGDVHKDIVCRQRISARFSSTAMIIATRSELTPLTFRLAAPMTLDAVSA